MLAGAGLIILMLAFLLASARGGAQPSARVLNLPIMDLMLLGGALLLIGGIIAWLAVRRPWQTAHDDWSVPAYTGHDEHHTAVAAHGEAGELVTEPFAHAEDTPARPSPAVMETMPTPEDVPAYSEMETAGGSVYMAGDLASDAPLGLVPQVDAPATLSADVTVTDDLTIVEGVGPKIQAALAGAGITTFAQLAEQEPAELERIVRAAGVRMVGKARNWPEQARLLAEGRLEEGKALAARLKSGR